VYPSAAAVIPVLRGFLPYNVKIKPVFAYRNIPYDIGEGH